MTPAEFLARVQEAEQQLAALVDATLEEPPTVEWVAMASTVAAASTVLRQLLSLGVPESSTQLAPEIPGAYADTEPSPDGRKHGSGS